MFLGDTEVRINSLASLIARSIAIRLTSHNGIVEFPLSCLSDLSVIGMEIDEDCDAIERKKKEELDLGISISLLSAKLISVSSLSSKVGAFSSIGDVRHTVFLRCPPWTIFWSLAPVEKSSISMKLVKCGTLERQSVTSSHCSLSRAFFCFLSLRSCEHFHKLRFNYQRKVWCSP